MQNIAIFAGLAGIISAFASFVVTPFVISFAQKFNLIDDPKKDKHPKKIHTRPIPRAGGLATFIAVFISSLIFLPFDKHIVGILVGAFLVVLIGVLDDKLDINPYIRLVANFVAAAIPIAAGIGIAFITNPFNGILDLSQPQINFVLLGETRSIWILSDLFALFWIVFLMNILNMGAKGIGGQLPGVVAIAALTISFLSLKFSADITQWPVIILAVITAGSFLGFLPWNFRPQKILPGYSGSTLAGYLLAILAILATTKVGTLLVVLGIPIIDTGYTIVRRILSGKSPVWGDTGHLHHKLLSAGFSKKQVVIFYWLMTALLGIIALYLNASFKLYTILGITIFVGSLLLLLYKNKNVVNRI
jgi:UDP-GlcNAc:undecaprenyl-phosphate GlcNAc-1-phosphate transferase